VVTWWATRRCALIRVEIDLRIRPLKNRGLRKAFHSVSSSGIEQEWSAGLLWWPEYLALLQLGRAQVR
jgi:hypothetical protein